MQYDSLIIIIRYASRLVSDIAFIEKQNYSVPNSDCVLKFTFELAPTDMKWAATFSGELVNLSFYFSSFGNVNADNKCTVGGSLGTDANCTWKPWQYQSRLDVAAKVTAKKEELAKTSYAESTKRNKVLNFIRSNDSRQEYEPILGQLVDKVYVEPLHNSNNAWQQLHEAMLSHSIHLFHSKYLVSIVSMNINLFWFVGGMITDVLRTPLHRSQRMC